MTKVTNSYGYEIDFDAAVVLMDDDIREALHSALATCTDSEFFDAYCKAHEQEYSEEFELAKSNPVW